MWMYNFSCSRKILISYPKVTRYFISFSTKNTLTKIHQNGIKNFCLYKNQKIYNNFLEKVKTAVQRNVSQIAHPNHSGNKKKVGIWLLSCAAAVQTAIALGGMTRLTESGLSMVTWRFTFEKFPTNDEEWVAEFEKYKQYPEFQQLKKDITIEEFKKIWFMEYFHRNWGRFIGLLFFIPAASFWLKGYFLPPLKKRVVAFGGLIIAQGLMGWYMVKSGLEDRFHELTDIPRVSQYRLAAHLSMALLLFSGFFWTALEIILPPQPSSILISSLKKFRVMAHSCKGLVFLTALSGAFVAGLDAGLVYNSFPKMGDKWIPDDILSLSPVYSNVTENPTTVQFNHRILGITTFSLIMATWAVSRKYPLPRRTRLATNILAIVACAQVIMGISTLVHYVPVSQALIHQSGSVTLLSIAIWLIMELKKLKYVPK